eukprot:TRINITY_DN57089_c0_g1_i1.p1 TRINITY_DN57089_c0_g1~~TRINITY_DN57089_c0_g1_i1.p1  ORF type:complete len:826 (+),score=168.70 TRINITY_DN57089_c0_g1_i1:36-2513(+)
MFRDRWVPVKCENSLPPTQGKLGKSQKLLANCFKIAWNPGSGIACYKYSLPNPKVSPKDEQGLLQQVWPKLEEKLGVFVLRCPGHLFSPKMVKDFTLPVGNETGGAVITVTFYDKISHGQVNTGLMDVSSVIAQHIVNKLAEPTRNQRVGRRYFNNCAVEGKSQLTIISGFCVAMSHLSQAGPMLQLDVANRPLSKLSIIEYLQKNMETSKTDPLQFAQEPEIMYAWQKLCVSATVVTFYNNRVYRIKAVHFDMHPGMEFDMYQRDEKKWQKITFADYYQAFYDKTVTYGKQPLLEAHAEKESERVYLLPELCALTGIADDIRKDKNMLTEALKQAKVSPQERLNAISSLAGEMLRGANSDATGSSQSIPIFDDWGCALEKQPLEVDARVLDPLQVCFTGKKTYVIEDGNFQKWLRNGLQCPVKIDDWVFIYPQADEPVLDIWLRSLRDIAHVAFTMKMSDPKRVQCSDHRKSIEQVVKEHVTPKTQLVLLLTPAKDSRMVYRMFKKMTCLKQPCITQVVKSETIRKRQSIAAVLSRIVLQVNAKFCGPLWHVHGTKTESEALIEPLNKEPTMVVGVDVYHTCEGERYMGFAATMDKPFSQLWSTSSVLPGDPKNKDGWRIPLSEKLQKAFRDAIVEFARVNSDLLPEHIVVYRASVNPEEWHMTRATELNAFRAVLEAIKAKFGNAAADQRYSPKLTFVTIAKRGNMRFFNPSPNINNLKNPEPGTVIDSPMACRNDIANFYLISQAISKGTAVPTHYAVLHSDNLSMDTIQHFSYRMCYMYYNAASSVRMPAPAMYAKKIASFAGQTLKAEPHPRLQPTIFYL